ncbi:MAG: hypothetical protein EXR27_22745 [Betaproteobacteria bacterium]|nr:hypothetical protein [Betaproteobacteria bacterium]
MLGSWFDASEAKRCGSALAEMVAKGYPASERKKGKKEVLHRAKLLDQIFLQAVQFKQTHNPNLYKRAQIGNAFKWKLLEQGFEADFVDDLTHQLLLHMK